MAVAQTIVFFRIRFWQRLVAGCAGYGRNAGSIASGFCIVPVGHRRLDTSSIVYRLVFLGYPHLRLYREELGIQDYGGIVWDEIVAMLLVLSLIPFKWSWWLAAFVIFRLFDALKPWPIKWFDQRIHGGLGIMLDDLIAAVMTLMVLGLFYWIA